MRILQGQVAVITGGASGIGEASVRRFIQAGAQVVVADVQDDLGRRLADAMGPTCSYRHVDVSLAQDVRRLLGDTVERHGRLDILFNNAGIAGPACGIGNLTPETWDAMLAVLLRSVYLGMHYAAGWMRRQGRGCIISTAGVAGLQAGWGSHVYAAANAAVIQLTRSVALELGACGIRVNCICPGELATPLHGAALGLAPQQARASLPALAGALAGAQPLPWAGRPEDVAEAALWLAGEQARFVNGHALVVDGGQACGRTWDASQQARERLRKALCGG